MYPAKTESMIKNTTHSSMGCNGVGNNDDYHGLEMYKNHAKDSTTEGYMQPDPTNMESGRSIPQSQGNAPIECRQWLQQQLTPCIGKLLLRTTGHNALHSCLKRLIIRLSKHIAQWLPPAHPGSLASQCMSGQPISTCRALASSKPSSLMLTHME